MPELPARLRAARAYAGFTQPDLAARLELGEVTYANSERGLRTVARRELLAIAEACDVPMWFLEDGWEGWVNQLREAAQKAPKGARDPMQVAEEAVALVQGRPAPTRRQRTGS